MAPRSSLGQKNRNNNRMKNETRVGLGWTGDDVIITRRSIYVTSGGAIGLHDQVHVKSINVQVSMSKKPLTT